MFALAFVVAIVFVCVAVFMFVIVIVAVFYHVIDVRILVTEHRRSKRPRPPSWSPWPHRGPPRTLAAAL